MYRDVWTEAKQALKSSISDSRLSLSSMLLFRKVEMHAMDTTNLRIQTFPLYPRPATHSDVPECRHLNPCVSHSFLALPLSCSFENLAYTLTLYPALAICEHVSFRHQVRCCKIPSVAVSMSSLRGTTSARDHGTLRLHASSCHDSATICINLALARLWANR